jgi:transposase-like protein
MQVNIKCPACNTDSSFFIAKNVFSGPFKCWKCKALFTLKVKDSEVKSCEPLAQEVFDKAKADAEARRKKKKEKA